MTCIIVKFKHQQKSSLTDDVVEESDLVTKRSLTDDVEEESDLVTDCKKPKLDVTAPESVE